MVSVKIPLNTSCVWHSWLAPKALHPFFFFFFFTTETTTTPLHHCQDRWPLYINIHVKYTFRGAGRNEHANLVHRYSSQLKQKASTQDSSWEHWPPGVFPKGHANLGLVFGTLKSCCFFFSSNHPLTPDWHFFLSQRSRKLSKTLLRARTVHGFKSLNTDFTQSIREAKHKYSS